MQNKFSQLTLPMFIALSILLIPLNLVATETSVLNEQGSRSDDQKYGGLWVGSYSQENGGTGDLSYKLSKDEKGEWQGTVKYTNQNGEQTAKFSALQIADGKMKARLESPSGDAEITIEGQFQGDQLEGSFAISPKNSTEIVEKGNWKVARSRETKTGQ